MNRSEREREELLSAYIEALVNGQRAVNVFRDVAADDDELRELGALSDELSRMAIVPPAGLSVRVANQLRGPRRRLIRGVMDHVQGIGASLFGLLSARSARPRLPRLAVAVAAVLLLVLAGLDFASIRTVSASDILTRAQAAVRNLAGPGELLFRRWRIVETITEPDGREREQTRYLLEWMDGADNKRSVGRTLDASGHLYLAYVSGPVEGGHAPRVYYEPGFGGEPRGLVSIIPSPEEFQSAANRFPDDVRPLLTAYLAQGYLPFRPILGELLQNEAVLTDTVNPIPPISPLKASAVQVEENGRNVFRVQYTEPVRVVFRWRSEGPPRTWLSRRDIVRHVDADTFLSLSTESFEEDENGVRIVSKRELVETRIVKLPLDESDNPFDLKVAADVPVRQQSAYQHLSQVAEALKRAPEFVESARARTTVQ
jgi:hypothetical protein